MKISKLAISIGAVLFAGFVGSAFIIPVIPTWYATIIKPSFKPPDWSFPLVWTFLYTFMGVASALVWSKGFDKHLVDTALVIYYIQLALNVMWIFFFFGLCSPFPAFIEIFFLLAAIFLTIIYFFKISVLAGLLMIPYFCLVIYAAIINYSICILNP